MNSIYPGLHIVFEGPDAVGKSTQIAKTEKYLVELGYTVLLTREPGGTKVGSILRDIVLNTNIDIDPKTEALIMAADRAQDVAENIIPALVRGEIVLSDRYTPSSLVYQGIVRELGIQEIQELNKYATSNHEPDLILCFDLEDHIVKGRLSDDPDRIEKEGDGFHQKIREVYRLLSQTNSWSVVEANGDEQEVFARIQNLINPYLKNKGM